jgi:Fe2+ transport system protein FeoA
MQVILNKASHMFKFFSASTGNLSSASLAEEGWVSKALRFAFPSPPLLAAGSKQSLTLADAKPGQNVLLQAVRDSETEMTLLRVGLSLGQTVRVLAKPPAGPVVLEQDGLELALGHMYAAAIDIKLL